MKNTQRLIREEVVRNIRDLNLISEPRLQSYSDSTFEKPQKPQDQYEPEFRIEALVEWENRNKS